MSRTLLSQCEYHLTGDPRTVAALPYYIEVGRALTIWALTENQMSEFYCMLVCGRNSPADGAITTFQTLRSFDDRRNLILKCLNQVLYPNEFNDFRRQIRTKLNKIQKLSETRNKIAHGAVFEQDETGNFYFHPYFIEAVKLRQEGLKRIHGQHPSTVSKQLRWNLEELIEKVALLDEALVLASELISDLAAQYEEHSKLLQGTTRMLLNPGLPYRDRPKGPN